VGFDVADQIAVSVSERAPVNGIRIVGVDGRSGAGKSFLASRLSSLLSAPVIEIDDFVSWGVLRGAVAPLRRTGPFAAPGRPGRDVPGQGLDRLVRIVSRRLEDATVVTYRHS
jgi:predicted kinase